MGRQFTEDDYKYYFYTTLDVVRDCNTSITDYSTNDKTFFSHLLYLFGALTCEDSPYVNTIKEGKDSEEVEMEISLRQSEGDDKFYEFEKFKEMKEEFICIEDKDTKLEIVAMCLANLAVIKIFHKREITVDNIISIMLNLMEILVYAGEE